MKPVEGQTNIIHFFYFFEYRNGPNGKFMWKWVVPIILFLFLEYTSYIPRYFTLSNPFVVYKVMPPSPSIVKLQQCCHFYYMYYWWLLGSRSWKVLMLKDLRLILRFLSSKVRGNWFLQGLWNYSMFHHSIIFFSVSWYLFLLMHDGEWKIQQEYWTVEDIVDRTIYMSV